MVAQRAVTMDDIRRFVKAVKGQGIHLRHAYLFGSFARGTHSESSDVDIALVADEFVGVSFEDIKWFIDLTIRPAYFGFEFHTFNTADFEKGDPFVDEIKRTGIEIG